MNDYFLNDRNKKWFKIIDGIAVNDENTFYNVLYMAISKHPSYVILSDVTAERKSNILNKMLTYFEIREEFEKCAYIHNINKQINSTC